MCTFKNKPYSPPMKHSGIRILLLHSHCAQWPEAVTILTNNWHCAIIEVAGDFPGMLSSINKQQPHLIILLGGTKENEYIHYIKSMRSNKDTDQVPIFIYNSLPTPEDIVQLQQQLTASTN